MIFTLFSPAESKHSGGEELVIDELLFGLDNRAEILECYRDIVLTLDKSAALELFGLKKEADARSFFDDIFTSPTLRAIERYSGVAYKYLDVDTLSPIQREYIYTNTVVFSNLFGPILAGDKIPNYKVKQTNHVGDIAPDRYYKELFQDKLDEMFEPFELLDLRASYYTKFYKPTQSVTTMKFLKNGKVVSHFAKAYRGLVLRSLAKHRCESIDEFLSIDIDGLEIVQIVEGRSKREIVYNIMA